jgi:PilZ domain
MTRFEDGFDGCDNRKGPLPAEESVTDLDAGNVQQHDTLLSDNTVEKNVILDMNHSTNIHDSFDFDSPSDNTKNNRVTTRFIRDDITVTIKAPGRFYFGKPITVNLMDISCKGVLISTDKKFGINKQITLTLEFTSGKIFVIKAKVVRHTSSSLNEYGLKFDRYNNELGDYLLESQDKLIFK